MFDYRSLLLQISVLAIPLIFAITLHEAAHGFVAYRLGDDTAKRMGRVTFNPLKHIDPFGTILLPLVILLATSQGHSRPFFFGYAKPVPVNFARLNHPRMDMVWVALAGPGINIVMAVAAALLIHVLPFVPDIANRWAQLNLVNAVQYNVLLAVFNMIPLPPLDGGRVAVGLLPNFLALPLARLERYGAFIVIGVLLLVPWLGSQVGLDLGFVQYVVSWPSYVIIQGIAWLTGVS